MPFEWMPLQKDLDGLIFWLETKDPGTEYNFVDQKACLLTQFGRACGERRISGHPTIPGNANEWRPTPDVYAAALPPYGGCWDTFGAALERAKALRDGR